LFRLLPQQCWQNLPDQAVGDAAHFVLHLGQPRFPQIPRSLIVLTGRQLGNAPR
jgi:hypothetical protein